MTRIFDLPGPAFLTFYGLAWVVVGMLAWTIRRGLAKPDDTGRLREEKLDPFEVAWLRGRGRAVADAALAGLMHDGVVSVDSGKVQLTEHGQRPVKPSQIEAIALASLEGKRDVTLSGLRDTLTKRADALFRPGLEEAGLVLPTDQEPRVQLLSATPALLLLLLGGVKLLIGLSRHKPSTFLLLGSIAGLVAVGVWLASDGWWRTIRGDAALGRLARRHAALQRTVARSASWSSDATPATALSGGDVALACGLFGLGSLSQPALLPIQHSLAPPSQGGSGCGSGGSGCGSGCGGGGCGGGCGGCGG